jgi:type I restriction enzyme, S subunit
MKLETFFEKFDQFADAPSAVAKMRELVLDWAASGKLSDHNSAKWSEGVLGDVIELISGQHLLAHEHNAEGRGIPYLTGPSDFGEKYPIPSRWTDQPKVTAEPGDILITVKGSGVGKTNVLIDQRTAISRQLMAIRVTGADPDYVHLVLKRAGEHFQNAKTGIAIPGIGRREVLGLQIPLPPLAEQKRIVAKVDELMALCDRLDAQQRAREAQSSQLARASLARFATAPTPANLKYLFHPSYNISPSDLRKSILTLAVQGKLVPQNPNDEPAHALLDQIAAYKGTVAKEGKFRGSITVSAMNDVEPSFDLPSSWCWVRFGDIMVNRDGERIPVSKEDRETRAKTYDYYGASGVIDKIDGYLFDKPLLLIGEDGANLINRSTPIAFIARGKYWVNNHAHVLDGISEDFLKFIELHINAINLEKYITGSAQPKMNQAKMNSIPIALPPLAEQRRIVAKVEQLMTLVDELETHLTPTRTTAQNLLSALVAELTLK